MNQEKLDKSLECCSSQVNRCVDHNYQMVKCNHPEAIAAAYRSEKAKREKAEGKYMVLLGSHDVAIKRAEKAEEDITTELLSVGKEWAEDKKIDSERIEKLESELAEALHNPMAVAKKMVGKAEARAGELEKELALVLEANNKEYREIGRLNVEHEQQVSILQAWMRAYDLEVSDRKKSETALEQSKKELAKEKDKCLQSCKQLEQSGLELARVRSAAEKLKGDYEHYLEGFEDAKRKRDKCLRDLNETIFVAHLREDLPAFIKTLSPSDSKAWHDKEFVRREELEHAEVRESRLRGWLESKRQALDYTIGQKNHFKAELEQVKSGLAGEIEKRVGALRKIHKIDQDELVHAVENSGGFIKPENDYEVAVNKGNDMAIKAVKERLKQLREVRAKKVPAPTVAKGEKQ